MKTKYTILVYLLSIILISAILYYKFFSQIDIKQNQAEVSSVPAAELQRISPPQKLDSFLITNEEGQKLSIEDFEGKILLINFWAKWCKPCIKELPQLDKLINIIGKENIEILAISIDSNITSKQIRDFYEEKNIENLKIYTDKKIKAYEAMKSAGVPTTILVDRSLRAHMKISGYMNWEDPQVINLINQLP